MGTLRIVGGRIHDPANGVDGDVRDLLIADGRIVEELPADAPTLDAHGAVVMPGGVDVHAHIAGPKVNAARKLLPEQHRADPSDRTALLRSGTGGTVPSTYVTGYRYSLLGYTTVIDAAAPALAARHVLSELRDTPLIDAAFLVLLGDHHALLELIRRAGGRSSAALRDAVGWILEATGGYGVKLVNAGGVEAWKSGNRRLRSLDDEVPGHGVTPRQILDALATAIDDLGLPHPVHIHAHDLGVAGNWRTTLETIDAVAGRRAHLAHLQFHCYGGREGRRPSSRTAEILERLADRPELSCDVGQVMFGPATTMSADAQISARLRDLGADKWFASDTELETACGVVPYTYRARNDVHALQWAIGLELFLLSPDPWRVVLSTDHPNGGSFLSYPKLVRLLMDRGFRDEQIAAANPKAIARTRLADGLDREYTLNEIAIITRAGPARLLGLGHKGHLGVGADADVTVYVEQEDREAMFALPRYVVKGGELVVRDGELQATPAGDLLRVQTDHDPAIEETLRPLFDRYYDLDLDSYPVREPWLLEPARRVAATRPA